MIKILEKLKSLFKRKKDNDNRRNPMSSARSIINSNK